jgi:DNA-binding MarR family transcriptional regulator
MVKTMNDEVSDEKQSTEKSTIASIVKRTNAMKLLMYILTNIDGFESYTLQEVAEPLEMNENTAYKNLNKLVEIGLLGKEEPKGNKREKYYSVLDQNLAKKAIDKYRHWVGFCLARLVPYERLYASQLKQNKRFIEACKQYGFSIDEGITLILGCYKIGKEQDGTEVIVWRQEQGYDA